MRLSADELSAIAPFHLVMGSDSRAVSIGPGFRRLFPDLGQGVEVSRFLRLARPSAELDYESLRARVGLLTILGARTSKLALRGQVIVLENLGALLFAGTPVVTDGEELKAYGLSFSDFAVHDPIFDYLFLVQSVRVSLRESRTLSEQRAFLAEGGRQLSSSLDLATVLACGARLVVPQLAEGCVALFQNGEGQGLTASFHADPEKASQLAVLEKNVGALLAGDAGALNESLRASGFPVHARVALNSRGRTLGTLLLLSARGDGVFNPGRLSLAEELAHRIAASLDNAQLYVSSQRAVRLRDEFLAVASHELQTPLTSISMQVQMLHRLLQNDRLQELPKQKLSLLINHSEREIARFAALVENLLDFSRISSGGLRLNLANPPLSLSELVQRVVNRAQADLAAANCEVALELDTAIHGAWDEVRIEQVVTNLLTNAIKYGNSRPVKIRTWVDGRTARLTVADEGIGIAAADLHRIFERFERAVSVNAYGGLGLGLYIVKEIVAAHGGEVAVTSELHQGSVFQVALPL